MWASCRYSGAGATAPMPETTEVSRTQGTLSGAAGHARQVLAIVDTIRGRRSLGVPDEAVLVPGIEGPEEVRHIRPAVGPGHHILCQRHTLAEFSDHERDLRGNSRCEGVL